MLEILSIVVVDLLLLHELHIKGKMYFRIQAFIFGTVLLTLLVLNGVTSIYDPVHCSSVSVRCRSR